MQIQPQTEWNRSRFPSVQPGLGFSPPQYNSGLPAVGQQLQLSGTEVHRTKQPAKPPEDSFYEEKRKGHGNASTWMTLYKVFGPLVAGVGFGALFGSSIPVAAGVSVLISAIQAGTVLKIHKEDTQWGKDIVHSARKVMGRENDHSAAGKEWAMVPVWGAVCALTGLLEGGINHALGHKVNKLTIKDVEKLTREKKGFLRSLYTLQLKGMNTVSTLIDLVENNCPNILEKPKTFILQKLRNNAGGNVKLGYLAAVLGASLGGMLTSASAAKVQEQLDTRHSAKANGKSQGATVQDAKKHDKKKADESSGDKTQPDPKDSALPLNADAQIEPGTDKKQPEPPVEKVEEKDRLKNEPPNEPLTDAAQGSGVSQSPEQTGKKEKKQEPEMEKKPEKSFFSQRQEEQPMAPVTPANNSPIFPWLQNNQTKLDIRPQFNQPNRSEGFVWPFHQSVNPFNDPNGGLPLQTWRTAQNQAFQPMPQWVPPV